MGEDMIVDGQAFWIGDDGRWRTEVKGCVAVIGNALVVTLLDEIRHQRLAHDQIVTWVCETLGYPIDISTPDDPIPAAFRDGVEQWWADRSDTWQEGESMRALVAKEGGWGNHG